MTWTLVVLFVVGMIALLVNRSQVTGGFVTFFARVERRYSDGVVGIGMGLLMHVFRLVVVSLALYWSLWTLYGQGSPFSPLPLAWIVLAAALMWLLHRIMLFWVCATFSRRSEMQAYSNHYFGLWTAVSVVLFVLLIFGTYMESPRPILIAMVVVMGLYVLAVWMKALTVAPLSMRRLVYVPLYVVTVDVVPLVALFCVGKIIVTL